MATDTGGHRSKSDVLAFLAAERFVRWTDRDPIARDALDAVDPGQLKLLLARFHDEEARAVLRDFDAELENLVSQERLDHHHRKRQNALERIMVKRIVHLFPKDGELERGSDAISRRCLPGLFHATEMMIGHDDIRVRREKCLQMLEDERANSEKVDWDQLYQNDEANDMIDDVLASGLSHFDALDQRLRWFVKVVNDNLASPLAYAFEGDGVTTWALTESTARSVLVSLYSRLRSRLERPGGREDLTQLYGAETIVKLDQFLDQI